MDQKLRYLYEERITLWQAESIDQAIDLAENEASEYSGESSEFLGFSQAYAMFEFAQENGIEVFSLLRESNMEPEEYLKSFFDSGFERHGNI